MLWMVNSVTLLTFKSSFFYLVRFQTSKDERNDKLEVVSCKLRVVSCYFKEINLRAASYFLRVTDFKDQVASCWLNFTSCIAALRLELKKL